MAENPRPASYPEGVFVKICGITREDDALLAVAMGADAVGFVFAPSTRQIASGIARDIARRLPPEILTVGVFRDQAPSRVVDIVNSSGLRAAQLHGHESAEDTAWVRARVPFVIKAFSVGDPGLHQLDDYGCDAVLVDGPEPGSGRTFDWSRLGDTLRDRRFILAGGLNPDNVGEAVSRVRPWGVDVSTGVESDRGEPGQKDARRVRAFISAARAAQPAEDHDPDLDLDVVAPYDWMQDDRR